jgi:hypothetical protein
MIFRGIFPILLLISLSFVATSSARKSDRGKKADKTSETEVIGSLDGKSNHEESKLNTNSTELTLKKDQGKYWRQNSQNLEL